MRMAAGVRRRALLVLVVAAAAQALPLPRPFVTLERRLRAAAGPGTLRSAFETIVHHVSQEDEGSCVAARDPIRRAPRYPRVSARASGPPLSGCSARCAVWSALTALAGARGRRRR